MSDQTNVALDLASKAVLAATRFINALETLEKINRHSDKTNINFNQYDVAFLERNLSHVDGGKLNRLLAAVPEIRLYLETTESGNTTLDRVFYLLMEG